MHNRLKITLFAIILLLLFSCKENNITEQPASPNTATIKKLTSIWHTIIEENGEKIDFYLNLIRLNFDNSEFQSTV